MPDTDQLPQEMEGCANPECSCVPYDSGPLASERMPWKATVCDDGRVMVHNEGDIICVPDPNHVAGCAWDLARFRLIAAAPDLLAVAIQSAEPYDGLTDDEVVGIYGGGEAKLCFALRAAIAKALTHD
jgi:hypothetical protein